MNETVYLGNLNYNCTPEELRILCESFGEVFRVNIINNFETGQSRGFAFVTYISESSAFQAIMELNGRSFQNRVLKVAQAIPRQVPGR